MLAVLLQVAGGLMVAVGVFLLFGVGVSLVVGGVSLVALGTLAELRPAPRRRAGDDGERYTS